MSAGARPKARKRQLDSGGAGLEEQPPTSFLRSCVLLAIAPPALVVALWLGTAIHRATWPVWLFLLLAAAGWAWCSDQKWLREAGNAVLGPATLGLGFLFVVTLAVNLLRLPVRGDMLREIESFVISIHFWLKELATPNFLTVVALLWATLVLVYWKTHGKRSPEVAGAVRKVVRIRSALGASSMFLLTVTSFTFFSTVPTGRVLIDVHGRMSLEEITGRDQLQLLQRSERDAVAQYLAARTIEASVSGATSQEQHLRDLGLALQDIEKETETELAGYPFDFQVDWHNRDVRRAQREIERPIEPLVPIPTADQLRRGLWSSLVDQLWLKPAAETADRLFPGPEVERSNGIDTVRQRRIPKDFEQYQEHRTDLEELERKIEDWESRARRAEVRKNEAKDASKALLVAAFADVVKLPESVIGKFAEALIESWSKPIAARIADHAAERVEPLPSLESTLLERLRGERRISRVVLPETLIADPAGFRNETLTMISRVNGTGRARERFDRQAAKLAEWTRDRSESNERRQKERRRRIVPRR